MAIRHVFIDRPWYDVWKVLGDGKKYARWVVGTRDVPQTDERWPEPGAELRYVARYGPFGLSGRTVVRICEPPSRLELEVEAGVLGSVRVAIRLLPWGDGTVVVLDEHPLRGIGAGLHGPVTELLLHLRNRLMLRDLAKVVQESTAGPEELKAASRVPSGAAGRR